MGSHNASQQKSCAVCGEPVPDGVVQCPSCGRGVFRVGASLEARGPGPATTRRKTVIALVLWAFFSMLRMAIGKPLWSLIGAVVLFALVLAVLNCVGGSPSGGVSNEVVGALSGVCQGHGVTGAADYVDRPEPNKIVLMDLEGRKIVWSDHLPGKWNPQTVGEAELVACVDRDEFDHQPSEQMEVCHYKPWLFGGSSGDITRYRHYVHVQIREARTGNVIASQVVYGSDPRECREHESQLGDRTGGEVRDEQLKEFFRAYVE